MLLPRPGSRPNERRNLTLNLGEKPGTLKAQDDSLIDHWATVCAILACLPSGE